MEIRDGGCRFPGCTHKRFVHAHHVEHWIDDGPTALSNLVSLCSSCHKRVHELGFEVRVEADGDFGFYAPAGFRIEPVGDRGRTPVAPDLPDGLVTPTCGWDGTPPDYHHIMKVIWQTEHPPVATWQR